MKVLLVLLWLVSTTVSWASACDPEEQKFLKNESGIKFLVHNFDNNSMKGDQIENFFRFLNFSSSQHSFPFILTSIPFQGIYQNFFKIDGGFCRTNGFHFIILGINGTRGHPMNFLFFGCELFLFENKNVKIAIMDSILYREMIVNATSKNDFIKTHRGFPETLCKCDETWKYTQECLSGVKASSITTNMIAIEFVVFFVLVLTVYCLSQLCKKK